MSARQYPSALACAASVAVALGLTGCGPTGDNTTANATSAAAPGDDASTPTSGSPAASTPPTTDPSSGSTPASPPASSPPASSPPASTPPASPASGNVFSFTPAGQLVSGSGGPGIADGFQWAPDIVFPISDLPAFANSQVWGHGGSSGPGGGQCDSANYSYPWHDNFCETRSEGNHRCTSGQGHQGQDIRPGTCHIKVHPVVAVEPGVITNIGKFSITLTADSGRIYRYLHIDMAEVKTLLKPGQHVNTGDLVGHVSHDFNSTPTTIHLHFEIIVPTADYAGPGYNFVPGYASLVAAYQRKLAAAGVPG